jgi:hypothetical protein
MRLSTLFYGLALLALGAITFYPLYMLAVFCLDYAYGGRILWQSLVYEWSSHTIRLLQADWFRALPVGAAVCGPLLLPELLRARGAGNTFMTVVSAALVVAIVLVFRMLGFEGTQLIPVGFAALVFALGSRLALRRHRSHS